MGRGTVIVNVQALRAIAALMVVAWHACAVLPGLPRFQVGNAGVDLFFVISGFVMVHTTRGRPITPGGFFSHRIQRIVPLYWTITFAVFAIAAVAPQLMGATRPDPVQLAKSLAFVPFVKASGDMFPVVFVGWTLNYEMFFYLLFAVGLWRGGVGLVLAALVLLAGLHPLTGVQPSVANFYTQPIVLEFGAGMLIALLWERASFGVWACVGLVALAIPFALAGQGAAQELRPPTYGVAGALLVLAALRLERLGWQVRHPLVLLLGDASYAIYLTHFFVTQAAAKVADKIAAPLATRMVFYAAALVAAAIVGVIVHRFVEKPLGRAARQLAGRLPRRPSLGAETAVS